MSHKCCYVVFSFSFCSKCFWNSFETSSLICGLFWSVFFSFHVFGVFLVWFHCNQKTMLHNFSYFKFTGCFCLFVYGPGYGLSWYMLQRRLERMWILLLPGGAPYMCSSDPVGWRCCWVLLYPRWFSICSITYWERAFKSLTVIGNLSISPFSSISFCFRYSAVLLFSAYAFRIAVTSWIDLFIII